MLQLLRFNRDAATGHVDVLLEYDLATGKMHHEANKFITEEVAEEFVCNCMRSYLLKKLQRFIDHKKILKECSKQWCTEQDAPDKSRSLSTIQWNVDHMKEYPLDIICMVIIKLEDHMRRVLPLPSQDSYKSSEHNIIDMIRTCSEYISAINHRKSKAA